MKLLKFIVVLLVGVWAILASPPIQASETVKDNVPSIEMVKHYFVKFVYAQDHFDQWFSPVSGYVKVYEVDNLKTENTSFDISDQSALLTHLFTYGHDPIRQC